MIEWFKAHPTLSDKESKQKIDELQGELQKTYAALGDKQSQPVPGSVGLTSNGFSPFVTRPGQNMDAPSPAATSEQPTPGAPPAQGASDAQAAEQKRKQAAMYLLGGGGFGYRSTLSDPKSKQRISELEDELEKTYSALGGTPDERRVTQLAGRLKGATYGTQVPYPTPTQPDTNALDRAAGYRPVNGYTYEYKDPQAPGAAAGQQSGPMAHELKQLPGVVEQGPDGMDRVNTDRLSLTNASEVGAQRRELDDLKRQLAALQGQPTKKNGALG